jgi:PPOX class probable F420-dependent enzyme
MKGETGLGSQGGAMPLPDAAKELIESGASAHLITLNKDGSSHVTLAWTGIEDDRIVIGTLMDQKKLKNMRRDPRVALSYETDNLNAIGMREYLVIHGTAEVTEGGAPELLQKLAYTYLGPDVTFPPMPDPPPGYVTRITVDKVGGMGPWAA